VSTRKLSISLDSGLAATVREAAAEEGVSVSTWIADAVTAKARQRALREALDAFARKHGALTEEEVDEIIASARREARVTGARRRAS
jgi:transposase